MKMKEGDIVAIEYYDKFNIELVHRPAPLCPNCKHGYLSDFWNEYTCNHCRAVFRKTKKGK